MPDDPNRDQELMRRVASGDEGAFRTLYERHGALLYGLALRILRRPDAAQDALQQTWVQVWQDAPRYTPDRGSVAAWLVVRARSRALDLLRKSGARRRAEERAREDGNRPEPKGEDPLARADRRHEYERVRGAMGVLKADERRVIEVAYFEGLTQREIAERFDVPLGSVKSWMRRGLQRLRGALTEGTSS